MSFAVELYFLLILIMKFCELPCLNSGNLHVHTYIHQLYSMVYRVKINEYIYIKYYFAS